MAVLSLNTATGQAQKALSRLSSGSRIVETSDDAAGAAVALKMQAAISRCDAADKNLQNADSFLRVQASALDALGKGVTRLMELKTLSLDATKNFSDIANYSAEFSQVRSALMTISKMQFNGIDLFSHTGVDTYLDLASDENGGQRVRLTQYALGVGATGWLSDDSTYSFVPGTFSWEAAKADAEKQGGHLATIETDLKWTQIVKDLGNKTQLWLWAGANQLPNSREPIGGWHWVNGNPIDWNQGHSGQADDKSGGGFGKQSYLRVTGKFGGCTWDDISNDDVLNLMLTAGYILERPAKHLPTISGGALDTTLQYISNCLANNGAEATAVGVSSDNIRTKSVSLDSAKGKITDTDVARETQNLSKAEIRSQISAAMVKQSTEAQKTVLKLIEQRLAGS